MSKKKMQNIVKGMASAVALVCTAIAAAVFPSYAVETDSMSSEGNIILEDTEAAFYADDIDYLADELDSLYGEMPDEDKVPTVPVDYVRKNEVKSKGIIDYAAGTVVLNAADIIYIANEMDVLENTYKYMILKYLNGIHTYMAADGSVTHNEAESDGSYFPTFGQLVNAISLSQEVSTGTTADNLSEGMGAWINGEYITGNGNDVNAAYSKGINDGHEEVVANPSAYGINTEPAYYGHIWSRHEEQTVTAYTCPETRDYTIIAQPLVERGGNVSYADETGIKLHIGSETINIASSDNDGNVWCSGNQVLTRTLPAGTQINVWVERTMIADGYTGGDHMAGYTLSELFLIIL